MHQKGRKRKFTKQYAADFTKKKGCHWLSFALKPFYGEKAGNKRLPADEGEAKSLK